MKWSSPLPRLRFECFQDDALSWWGLVYLARHSDWEDYGLYLHCHTLTLRLYLTWPERSRP